MKGLLKTNSAKIVSTFIFIILSTALVLYVLTSGRENDTLTESYTDSTSSDLGLITYSKNIGSLNISMFYSKEMRVRDQPTANDDLIFTDSFYFPPISRVSGSTNGDVPVSEVWISVFPNPYKLTLNDWVEAHTLASDKLHGYSRNEAREIYDKILEKQGIGDGLGLSDAGYGFGGYFPVGHYALEYNDYIISMSFVDFGEKDIEQWFAIMASSLSFNAEPEIDNTVKSDLDSFIRKSRTYSFANPTILSASNIKDLRIAECMADSPPIPADVTSYTYNFKDDYVLSSEKLGTVFYYVFKDMPEYLSDDVISKSYDEINKIFEGKADINASSGIYELGFKRHCGSGGSLGFAEISKYNYIGTENAYLLISFGSSQSASTVNDLDIQIDILSNIGDDYSWASFSTKYAYITNQNSLAECEKTSEYGYSYLDTGTPQGRECIRNAYQKDVDKQKLQNLLKQFEAVYKLPN